MPSRPPPTSAIAGQLAAVDPTNGQWQRELAIAQRNVARALDALGHSSAALEAFETALAIVKELAAIKASDVATQRDLLARYSDLGLLQDRLGRHAEAQDSYCWARAVAMTLANLQPSTGEWHERLAWLNQRLQTAQEGEAAPC